MKRMFGSAVAVLMVMLAAYAQTATQQPSAPEAKKLTQLLRDFLAGAGRNDVAMHDRFWAEDLIYTGSSGRRIGKAQLMSGVRAAPQPVEAATTYSAEDLRIHQYKDMAIVAFRLVAKASSASNAGEAGVTSYLNTGTFLKRHGEWRAVSWQATRLPSQEEEVKKQVAAAEAAFHQALLAGDSSALGVLVDESFVCTHRTGERSTRPQLLEEMRSGKLKYSQIENREVSVAVYGDTGVARGTSLRQFAPAAGAKPEESFTVYYTLTLVNRAGSWKVVAMHTSGK